jgi:LysR family transcriptional regulator, carnitine catabolism transcriptional activator
MNITSRQLKAFLLTARHQSFSRAAEQLFITQSGMSVLVRELEAQLGFRLFERTTRKVTLTEFGTKFLPIADRSLLELEAAAVNIGRSASAASGRLTIGAPPLVAADVLPPAIAAYTARNPHLDIRVIDAEGLRLVEMVQTGQIDVALTVFHQAVSGVRKLPLVRFSFMLIAADNGTGEPPAPLRWAELATRRLVGFPPDNPIQQLVDDRLQRAGRRDPPDIVCNYLETQIAMVEVGAGVAVMPTYAMPACLKRKVAVCALVDPVVSGNLYWIVSRGRKLTPDADGFSAFLKQYMSGWSEQWPPRAARVA